MDEKDKEEPTRKRRETRKVPDPVRIVRKKKGKSLVLDAAETIPEEDCSSVLFDDPTTATVSDPVTEASAGYAVNQSVARQRVGNNTVLEESCLLTSSDILMLFDGSVSASSGAMRPLVQKLDMLLAPAQEYSSLPKRIKDGMHLLKDDVEDISSYLDELLEVEDPPPMAICWMNEARGLSYDMEDYIDSLSVSPNRFNKNKRKKKKKKKKIKKKLKWYKQVAYVVQVSEHGIKSSKVIHVSVPRLPSKPKIAEKISDFRIYVLEAIERYDRYRLQCCSTLRRRFLSTGSMLPVPYEEAAEIVIDDRMNEFINSLATNDAADQQQLKVVSILGSGCLGKTTLAKVLYSRIGMQFDCRAFIKVSKKPDMKTLFHDLFSQLHQKQQPLPANSNELGISDNTNKHLQDKRYLVVIDDLWDASVWDIIKYAFPKGNHGSRIIITTQIEDVALTCSWDHSEHVFQMKPLDDDHSRKLFFNRLFGSENNCPAEFKQVSNEIIDICGGLPLATINIASHLANQQTAVSLDLLTYIRDSLRSHLWSSSTSERTRQVLNFSYNNLPHYLKTCLLYLHMYPEGSVIWKDDLVKQWVAEGFIATRKGKEQDQEMIEKVAGIYFDALIDRRFIQPLYVNDDNMVFSCTVHDVVHDLIAHKSAEENFIVLADCNRNNIALPHKVRRLSLVFGDAKYAKTPANTRNTQIRSLGFFGLFECMPCIRGFKVLRVLNVQLSGHHGDHEPIDLTGISELFQLRYLKIASDVFIKLPNRMRGLQCLETLDVMDATGVTAVPWDIIYLPHLLHLTLPADTNLLDWIGSSMSDSVVNLWSLGQMNYLQDLHLTSSSTQPSHHLDRSMEALGSLIGGHGNLKTIVLALGCRVKGTVIRGAPKITISWDRMAPPPLLQRFECSPHSCIIFYRIPKWVTELGNLCILKISVKEVQMICVGILRGLPALTTLSLYVETAPLEPIIFDKAGFLVLKHFKLRFTSGIAWLKFEADAMPNLWILKLVFNAIPQMDQNHFISSNQVPFEAYQHGNALISIEHMPGLKEISAKFGGAAADVEYALRIGVRNHPSNPTINVQLGDYSSYGDERTEQKKRPDEVPEEKPDEYDKPLEIPTDKRILSRSPESSSCLHVPGAVGDPKRMRTGNSSTPSSSSSLGGEGARSFVVEAAPPATAAANAPALPVVVTQEQEHCILEKQHKIRAELPDPLPDLLISTPSTQTQTRDGGQNGGTERSREVLTQEQHRTLVKQHKLQEELLDPPPELLSTSSTQTQTRDGDLPYWIKSMLSEINAPPPLTLPPAPQPTTLASTSSTVTCGGYKVRASEMADVAQKLEQLEMAMGMGGGYKVRASDMADEALDELEMAIGYKVRASDMADVAQKQEQLKMAMGMGDVGAGAAPDDSFATHLATDTMHYSPTDLSSWVESMLSELNAPPPPLPPAPQPPTLASTSSTVTGGGYFDLPPSVDSSSSTYTLRPTPSPAVEPANLSADFVRDPKRMRTGGSSTSSPSSSSSSLGVGGARSSVVEAAPPATAAANAPVLPVVVVDTQEAGIRLVHALLACAEAVQQENLSAAEALVKQIPLLAASQGGAMRKVAAYFGEALARRVFRFHPQPDSSLHDAAFADLLHAHFYKSCPYLKFAHFTANQAILEAFAGCRRVHVVDFGIKQGMQWPALLQALALRPGGPPSFRLTGVGPPQQDETDALQQVGWKLAQFAHTIRVDFQYRGLVAATLADLEPFMLQPEGEEDPNEEPEVIAVNSVFEMHRLLAQPGALEKVLGTVHAVRPRIVTVVEQEADHNSGSFLDRFTESLRYYSIMFDSLEGAGSGPSEVSSGAAADTDQVMSEVHLGRQICNVVACEGAERTERHETLGQWRNRLGNAGFETVHLGSNAYKQASTLLALCARGDGYKVEEKEGCLTLGWHTRPLIVTSAWRLAAP